MSQHAIENPLFQRIYTLKKGGVKYKIFFNQIKEVPCFNCEKQ